MPEILYSAEDLRRVFGAQKGQELARALWAATQKPLPPEQLETLRAFCEGEDFGKGGRVFGIVPPLRVYLLDNPAVARRIAAWASDTLESGGIPGGLPLELQEPPQNGHRPIPSHLGRVPVGTVAQEILAALTANQPVPVTQLAAAIGRDVPNVNRNLRRLEALHKVESVPTGLAGGKPHNLWRLPDGP